MRSLFQSMFDPVKSLTRYRLFQRPETRMNSSEIILWWEARRVFFNFVVGIAGLVTLLALFFSATMAEKLVHEPIDWSELRTLGIISAVLYAIGANICYTGGWLGELISREVWGDEAGRFGEILFTLGMILAFVLTLLPGALAVYAVAARFVFIQVM